MVGHHGREFCEADALDADACEDLLVREGEEEFSGDGPLARAWAEFVQDDGEGEGEGEEGGYDEGEEDLGGF